MPSDRRRQKDDLGCMIDCTRLDGLGMDRRNCASSDADEADWQEVMAE